MIERSRPSWELTREPQFWPTSTGGIFARRSSAFTTGFWRSSLLYFTAYSSHLVIDFFSGTKIGWTHTGFGMPLFWPWSKEFSSPLILTFGIRHKDLAALFSLDNVWSCTYELLTCSAITVVALVLWKRRLKSRSFEHF